MDKIEPRDKQQHTHALLESRRFSQFQEAVRGGAWQLVH